MHWKETKTLVEGTRGVTMVALERFIQMIPEDKAVLVKPTSVKTWEVLEVEQVLDKGRTQHNVFASR